MSNTHSRRWGARLTASLGVVAVASMALGGTAFAASTPQYGNIDGSKPGSITVHKHAETGNTEIMGDPSGATGAPGAPLADVVFTAFPVLDLNLLTSQGWADVNSLAPSTDSCTAGAKLGAYTLGEGKPFEATDASGQATLGDLPVGAYVVCETSAPSTVAKKAAPFVVTIPFPDNQTGAPTNSDGWLYDVHAYPKNTMREGISKKIADQVKNGVQVGDLINYEITTKVPTLEVGSQFKEFDIQDPLVAQLANGAVTKVTLGTEELDLNVDYKVTTIGNTVIVYFTLDGLARLDVAQGQNITVFLEAKVDSMPDDGQIKNTAYVNFSDKPTPGTPDPDPEEPTPPDPVDPTDPTDPHLPSNPTQENWGPLKVLKIDGADAETPLAGAEFELYVVTGDEAAFGDNCAYANIKDANGTLTKVETSKSLVSGADGVVFDGALFIDQAEGDTEIANINAARCYVLKEIKAPVGFVTPTDDNAYTGVKVTVGDFASVVAIDIENNRGDVPDLPLTGAAGKVLMMIGGAALVLMAGGTALVARKRKQEIG